MQDQAQTITVLGALQGRGLPTCPFAQVPSVPGQHHPQHTNISSPRLVLVSGPQLPAVIFGGPPSPCAA